MSSPNVYFTTADVEQFYMIVNLMLAKLRLKVVMKGNPQFTALLSVSEAKEFMNFVNNNT